jgi:hypothetical protein
MKPKVEKNIPFKDNSRLDLYPFDEMEIGDSFVLYAAKEQQQMEVHNPVYRATSYFKRFHNPFFELYHELDESGILGEDGRKGIRFWRIKDKE